LLSIQTEKKMTRITLLIFTIPTLMLAACQSTGVIPMDRDSYMIGKKDGTPGVGVSLTNKAEVYREANAFCREKGLEVETLHVTTTPARPGQLGSTELQFRCTSPGGKAHPLVKESDTVIEIRNR
jgi:hypothetical protein